MDHRRGSGVGAAIPLVLLAGIASIVGCRRQKLPSDEFAKADRLFVRVYAEKLDDAFTDPRMAEVEQLLSLVPGQSADSSAAQQLRERIRIGRERAQSQETSRQTALAQASAPVTVDPRFAPRPKPDSGVVKSVESEPEGPATGMALDVFTHKFSTCFAPWKPVELTEQGVNHGMVDSWELKDIANCRDRHPGFEQRLVLTDGHKVVTVVNRAMLEVRRSDAGS